VSRALFGTFFFSPVSSVFTKRVVRFSRLPVRTLLFQCAVCNHGGHQSCYREYYMRQPMVDLPSSFLPPLTDSKDWTSTRNQLNNEDDSSSTISSQSNPIDLSSVTESPLQPSHKSAKLAGHPCAAGCGHFCWAANRDSED